MTQNRTTIKTDIHTRYHCIAGPFSSNEVSLMEGLREFLCKTGARIVAHSERGGTSIYRLRSECETMAETEARLARIRGRKP